MSISFCTVFRKKTATLFSCTILRTFLFKKTKEWLSQRDRPTLIHAYMCTLTMLGALEVVRAAYWAQ